MPPPPPAAVVAVPSGARGPQHRGCGVPLRSAPMTEPTAVPDEEHQPTRRRDDEADGRRGSAEVEVPSLSVSLEPRALHLWGNHTQSPNPGLHINHVHGQKVSG